MSENKLLYCVEDPFIIKDGESGELIEELKNLREGNWIRHRFVVDFYTGEPEHNNFLNKKYKMCK